MAQGKVERLGLRWDLRIEEKALRASIESPLRAKSAMMEFQEWTLLLSMYLLNSVVMFAVVVKRRRCSDKYQLNFILHLVFIFEVAGWPVFVCYIKKYCLQFILNLNQF